MARRPGQRARAPRPAAGAAFRGTRPGGGVSRAGPWFAPARAGGGIRRGAVARAEARPAAHQGPCGSWPAECSGHRGHAVLRRPRGRGAQRPGGGPPLLPRVQDDARPHGRGAAQQSPRRGASQPGPAAAHPCALPLLHPEQGLACRPGAIPGRRGRPLPLPEAPHPSRPAPAALLRHAQPAGRRAQPHGRGVRRRPVPERWPVRAAPARALAARRHPERSLARRVRPAVRAVPLHRGRRPRHRNRSRHARPRLRGSDGARRAPGLGHLLHAGRAGALGARRGARRRGGSAPRLRRGRGATQARRAGPGGMRRARCPHHSRPGGRLGGVSARCARAALELCRG